jgi:pimeloyl-ACP methyl ester carboxylesterase
MKLQHVAAGVMALAVALWIIGAAKGGYFIADRHAYVPGPADAPLDSFSARKQTADIGDWRVAYIDEGSGPPVVLLHGCPFSAWEWKDVIPMLTPHYRVIAPDLLGLGDTAVRLDDDYRLPNEMKMVTALLDRLGVKEARFVGHDHGGATCELLMKYHPERIHSLVLTNIEAYDQWPSKPETPYLRMILHPATGPFFRLAFGLPPLQREAYRVAVYAQSALTDEMLSAFVEPQLATAGRWCRLRRFFGWQIDPQHNLETMRALDGMKRFDRPVLILWGQHDTNFGPAIAERLAKDIPGVVRVEWMTNSAHLPMLEEPHAYAEALIRFFAEDNVPPHRESAASTH